MSDLDSLILEIADEEFTKVFDHAVKIMKEETPVDLGNLQDSVRGENKEVSDNSIQQDIVVGEKDSGGIFVDYQADVKIKGTGLTVPNLYYLIAEDRIINEL